MTKWIPKAAFGVYYTVSQHFYLRTVIKDVKNDPIAKFSGLLYYFSAFLFKNVLQKRSKAMFILYFKPVYLMLVEINILMFYGRLIKLIEVSRDDQSLKVGG